MSEDPSSFIELVLHGNRMSDEIDDYVDVWHEGGSGMTLREFLGFTDEEYQLWASDGTMLDVIVAARAQRIPLAKFANDNFADLEKIAARTDRPTKMARLKRWLEAQEADGARVS